MGEMVNINDYGIIPVVEPWQISEVDSCLVKYDSKHHVYICMNYGEYVATKSNPYPVILTAQDFFEMDM